MEEKRHQRAKLGDAAPSRYWKIYYLCYELNQNTESTLKHDSIEKMFKRKTKIFLPFVFIGKNIKARMLMMFRTTRSIAMRSWRTFIQTSTPKVTTYCLVFTPIFYKYINLINSKRYIYTFFVMNYLLNLRDELIVRNTLGATSSPRNLAKGRWIIIDASKRL